MAVPKFFEFFEAFLKAVNDGELHSAKEVRSIIEKDMSLSEVELAEMLPSGKQRTFDNRVAWARTYLDKAGLIETPLRGKYRITEAGKQALLSGTKIDISYLDNSENFRAFHSIDSHNAEGNSTPDQSETPNESPLEVLEGAYQQLTSTLADQLMGEVIKLTANEFERLVVKLLLKMGYGSGIDKAGIVTQQSNDGGIDGIIKEDQLGFSQIYIQAKKWDVSRTVNRPDVQGFVGALQGQQAQKGLFITTARFSQGATDYVNNLHNSVKVVLVDGESLTRLMIKHNLGVSVEEVYEVKKLDSDFFADEL